MAGFVLPIFPDGSLASSVITTVWVGAIVVCLMNLRFGWVLSGLVVPGYIVPLLISKPLAAVVVIAEAALTYGIFWFISERASGPGRWSAFFGRDRFFGLILTSAAVRVGLDGFILPRLAGWLERSLSVSLDWNHNLHSFGLVVVALYANQLWKPGFLRGMAQSFVVLGLTYILIRYGLMEFTNFRISGVAYLYEEFASSIYATPKAYILLISTCFIASLMNRRYGWDLGGILIPSLLALEWYQPFKILTSLVEAGLIFVICSALLKSSFFASTTIEGARKILLFFNVSFAYRILLGFALGWLGFNHRISDYYGFGYLLPTLLAIKAHDKAIAARLSAATLQVSLAGAFAGSMLGLALTLIVPETAGRSRWASGPNAQAPTIQSFVAYASGIARANAAANTDQFFSAVDSQSFAAGLDTLERGGSRKVAQQLLNLAHYELLTVDERTEAITPSSGRGPSFFLRRSSTKPLAIMVPVPAEAAGLSLAGTSLFNEMGARWLVIGGEGNTQSESSRADTPLTAFNRTVPSGQLELHASRAEANLLEVSGGVVRLLDLTRLRRTIDGLSVRFSQVDEPGAVADTGVLHLSVAGVANLVPLVVLNDVPALDLASLVRNERGVFASNLSTKREEPPPSLEIPELIYVRTEVVQPLTESSSKDDALFRMAEANARAAGYELSVANDGAAPLFVLRSRSKRLGLSIIRAGTAAGPIIEVAANAPEFVVSQALQLFRDLPGRAFIMAPSMAAFEQTEGQMTALVTQALLENSAGAAGSVLQLRPTPRSVSLVDRRSDYLAVDSLENRSAYADAMLRRLRDVGVPARLVMRDASTAGLEIGLHDQLTYLQQQTRDGRLAVLWLPPPPRSELH